MGMSKFANGFYTWSDEHFKSMKKQDLINYIRTIEKNWENALITNEIQYNNCKILLVEERKKVIDEYFDELCRTSESVRPVGMTGRHNVVLIERAMEIAEQMKVGGENV